MKRALTRSDGKVEKDAVTLSLEESRRHRGACLGVAEFGVRSVVATETISATSKLAREIEESASDVAGYGMVSYPKTSSRDNRPLDPPWEKAGDVESSMCA